MVSDKIEGISHLIIIGIVLVLIGAQLIYAAFFKEK
jgi:hypothetical protein